MQINTKYGIATLIENCILTGTSESLSWLTEVHTSYSGYEDRYALRDAPRQNFDISLGNGNILKGNIRGLFALPLPFIKNTVEQLDETTLLANTELTAPDIRKGYAIVNGEVVEIVSMDSDSYTLADEIELTGEAKIIPLRICIIEDDAQINYGFTGDSSRLRLRVLAEDSPYYEADEPTQFLENDIYLGSLLDQNYFTTVQLTQHQNIVDNQIGAFQPFTDWHKSKTLFPRYFLNRSHAQLQDFRKFLFRRSGRYREFWQPLPIKLNAGDTTYPYIAVKYSSGWSAQSSSSSTTGALYIAPLVLCRLDADEISIEYLGNDVSRTTIPTTEVF